MALKNMHPTKAPAPDGVHVVFYQKYWHIVGDDISALVLDCLNNAQPLELLNDTHIVLIPKVKKALRMTEFRPISLCNVIYKLISKTIVNRLKPILSHLVDETQSAFVKGRLIIDNIIVAIEAFHWIKNGYGGVRDDCMAIKLDMSKTYD